ncbi:MAG: glycosyltransferase [Campylobacter sp.]|uniref:glycosyltransferase family 2 protein n=1 Tax=Campylobacter sp. TaxID=205 RepID=UPI001AFE07DA|nr:glycosyltransferase [Campylobacter sp.]MBO5063504.1 glycosyltransferase [Campylobacter sp.]
MKLSTKISVCILVKNAQDAIKECLESLQGFDEIILLDNQSSDDTLKIANEFKNKFGNLRIYSSEFIGFGPLKNLAISYASNDWIFSIDSDEVLELSTLKELESLELNSNNIYAMPRKNLYKGEWIKACGWHPDFVLRLFNKTKTKFNSNFVHESLEVGNLNVVKLKNGLRHYAYDNISVLIDKMQKYSTLWAKQNRCKSSTMASAVLHGGWKFIRDYFFKSGFMYGYKGFVISFCNALGAFFKYAKLYELNHQMPSVSLVVTTYNNEKYLEQVLKSIESLDYLPNEVLIADDGSGKNTANLISKFKQNFPCELRHIWHEDRGFRASAIRNKAINSAKSEYIIIIDGDMVLDRNFILDHLKFAKKNQILQGSRVVLNESQTVSIIRGGNVCEFKSFKSTRNAILSKLIYKSWAIKLDFFNKKDFIKGIRSCNMSFYKSDCMAIGGFNESFIGWGREDSEFVARFLFNGGELRRMKFAGIAYHLYHAENSREMLESNHQIYLDTIKNKRVNWQ